MAKLLLIVILVNWICQRLFLQDLTQWLLTILIGVCTRSRLSCITWLSLKDCLNDSPFFLKLFVQFREHALGEGVVLVILKKLKVKINRNADNYFILYAHNEGSRPPNTAALIIYDGKRHQQMALSSDMKKCDAVNFKFKDKWCLTFLSSKKYNVEFH